jgi:hypothetical protein
MRISATTLGFALWLSLLVACIGGGGCNGSIDTEHPRTDGISPGLPGGGSPLPDPNVGDDEMRAQDPELFDVATHYFPGTTAAGGKKRLFRLTRAQLDLTTQTLLPGSYTESVTTAMPRDPLQTNYEYSDNLSWNGANLTPYASWVSAIAQNVGSTKPETVAACASASDVACLEQGSDAFVTRAFRGVATPEQLDRFSSFFVTSAAARGVPDAVTDLVDVTLTSPGYVFRDEVLTDGTGALLPAQRLQNLTYTLADAPPEALALTTAAAPEAQLDAVLASTLARDKLIRFFVAWLEIKEPADFGLAANIFPEWTEQVASAAVQDTKAFLARELGGPTPSLKSITQASDAFASPETAFLYGANVTTNATPIATAPMERLGIFTQPAVVASHSGPTTTRLIKRGVFFTRKVMCLPLGNPPPGIDTTIPETPNATERQRIETLTANQPCAGCHTFINPFGFMQQSFDPLGRFRTRDEAGLPIDPSISIDFLDEGPLSAQTGVDALRALTDTTRFKQCFTRQLFRFYMGRDEVATDDPLLRQMYFAFAKDDRQDILAALRTLAGSPSFSQRTEMP